MTFLTAVGFPTSARVWLYMIKGDEEEYNRKYQKQLRALSSVVVSFSSETLLSSNVSSPTASLAKSANISSFSGVVPSISTIGNALAVLYNAALKLEDIYKSLMTDCESDGDVYIMYSDIEEVLDSIDTEACSSQQSHNHQ